MSNLHRLQKTLFADARDAPVGHQVEVLTLRLNRGQPHPFTAFDAGHLDGGLKAVHVGVGPGICSIVSSNSKEETQRYSDQQARFQYVRFPTQLEQASGSSLRKNSALRDAAGFRVGGELIAGPVAIQMTSRSAAKHPVVAGFHALTGGGGTRGKAQLKQFAHSGGTRWHSMLKSEVVDGRQFFRRKHDLQPFIAEIVHGALQERAFPDIGVKLANYSIHSANTGSTDYP